MQTNHWQMVIDEIEQITGDTFNASSPEPVSGGSISSTWRLTGGVTSIFIKVDQQRSLLEAEAKGLDLLAASQTIRVPKLIAQGCIENYAYLALEWLDLVPSTKESEKLLGAKLASLHQVSRENFGFGEDNFIGRNRQRNAWSTQWPEFFRDYRLLPQLELANTQRFGSELKVLGNRVCDSVHAFFPETSMEVSLLHGDLWGGNCGTCVSGEPVIYDPAVYWGHREADIAMTELFGGFSREFYDAYDRVWSRSQHYSRRRDLYNLYHVLNHLNLFGGGYYAQALSLMKGLLRTL